MGLFGKRDPSPTVRTGFRQADKTLDLVLNDVAEHGRRGNDRYAFRISSGDVGGKPLAFITQNFPLWLQREGHSIMGMMPEERSGGVNFVVRPGTYVGQGHG